MGEDRPRLFGLFRERETGRTTDYFRRESKTVLGWSKKQTFWGKVFPGEGGWEVEGVGRWVGVTELWGNRLRLAGCSLAEGSM